MKSFKTEYFRYILAKKTSVLLSIKNKMKNKLIKLQVIKDKNFIFINLKKKT